jgi:hypothetical protein
VEEIKGRCQTNSRWLGEIIGAVHDVRTKAFGEAIDCHLQPALPSKGAEKIKLHQIVNADEVVGDETDQTERTGMINVVLGSSGRRPTAA